MWGVCRKRNVKSSFGAPPSAAARRAAPSSRGSYRQLYTCLCVVGFHFFGSRKSHCSPAASSNSGSASHAHSTAPAGNTERAFGGPAAPQRCRLHRRSLPLGLSHDDLGPAPHARVPCAAHQLQVTHSQTQVMGARCGIQSTHHLRHGTLEPRVHRSGRIGFGRGPCGKGRRIAPPRSSPSPAGRRGGR